MGKVLDYLLNECGCVLDEQKMDAPDGMPVSRAVRTAKGDYVTLEVLADNDDSVKFIYDKKLTQLQALDEGSGCAIQLGFSEPEQCWYGWTHRGHAGYKVGQKVKEGTIATNSQKYPVKGGFVCKTLEDCKRCACAAADALD